MPGPAHGLSVPRLDRRTVRLAGAVLLLVLALTTIAIGQWWLQQQRTDGEQEIRSSATEAVTAVLSYDYRRLEAGIADTRPMLTGDAEKQFHAVQKPLQASAPKLKSVVNARVKTMSVLESDDDSARVLLFVDQLSTSTKVTRPQLDQSRVLVTMTRSGDQWLVSTLEAI